MPEPVFLLCDDDGRFAIKRTLSQLRTDRFPVLLTMNVGDLRELESDLWAERTE
jgi:hypothetical protein